MNYGVRRGAAARLGMAEEVAELTSISASRFVVCDLNFNFDPLKAREARFARL